MAFAIGLDVVEIARMRTLIERTPGFIERYFSLAERDACPEHWLQARYYASLFAVKEAFLKALGHGVLGGIALDAIEVAIAGNEVTIQPQGSAIDAVEGAQLWAAIAYDAQRAWATVVLS